MRVDNAHLYCKVFILGGHACNALAATMLCLIGAGRNPLDVARVRQSDDHVFLSDQVFHINFALNGGQFSPALIGKLIADGEDFVFDHAHQELIIGENGLQVGNGLFEFLIFLQEPVAFQTGETGKTHVQNGLGLLFREFKGLHEAGLRGGSIRRIPDEGHDFVDVVECFQQTFQNMSTGLCFVQVKLGSAGDNILLMLQIIIDDVAQIQHAGLAVDQGEHIGAEGFLKRGVHVEEIQDNLRIDVLFQLNDNAHAVAVGFIADVRDAFNTLVADKVGNLAHQRGLVDHVGDFRDDDAAAAVPHVLNLGLAADIDVAVTGIVGLADAGFSENHAAGGEVRSLDVLHQVFNGAFRIVDHAHNAVNDFAEVMRRNIGGHADSNAVGTIDKQVREAGRKDCRLHEGFVEVRIEIDGVLFNAFQHVHGQLLQPGFGITHGSRAVTVHGTEVALAFDKRIADVERLGKTNHGVIDRGVAVRVKFTQNVTDNAGALAVRFVRCHAELSHIIENTAVHRLQTVAHIRQSTVHDDGHGIGNEALFHFLFQVDRYQLIFDITHDVAPSQRNQMSRSLTRSLFS